MILNKMSPEKALVELKEYLKLQIFPDLPGVEFYAEIEDALEKQILKQPLQEVHQVEFFQDYIYRCPSCNKVLLDQQRPHHCVCGQALLWVRPV